jgi:uncharacterized membrane protein (UPF0127 family)
MKRSYCVFNRTRESFLGLRVAPADTWLMRLRGALGRIGMKPDDGIWLSPSSGIHTIGMLFSIDLVYLDASNRVIYLVEHLGPGRISPIRMGCASILELESRSIYSSGTRVGDQLLICAPEDIEKYCGQKRSGHAMAVGQTRPHGLPDPAQQAGRAVR